MNVDAVKEPPVGTLGGKWLPAVAAVLFFAALWRLDFPKPFCDDLFYCGAGLHMAGGGDFSNPLLERQHFPSHYFFVYPPVHSFAIAGWMKLFGISALSLTGFQGLTYLLTAVATLAILQHHWAPAWLRWLVPLGVSASFLPFGLRPEPLSAALAMAGFALIECGCSRSVPVFFAFLLMFLGGAAAPRLTLFTAALVIAAAYHLWRGSNAPGLRRWLLCLPSLGALLMAVIIFLSLIGFRLAEFWETFHLHAHRVAGDKIHVLAGFFHGVLGSTQWPLFFLPLVLLALVPRQATNQLFLSSVIIMVAMLLTALVGGVGIGATWYAVLMLFFLAAAISRSSVRRKLLLPVVLWLVLLLANSRSLVNAAGVLGGAIQSDRDGLAAAAALRSAPQRPVLVDTSVARYVFDYRIPPGFIDFGASAPFPGLSVASYYRPQDIYAVGPQNVNYLRDYTHLDWPPPPKWLPLGLARWSFDKHPESVSIIPAEICKGLKYGS